jgi:NAD(P)H-dependent FMN reductase
MVRIGIILGSTRPNANGEQVANWVYDNAVRQGDADYEVIELYAERNKEAVGLVTHGGVDEARAAEHLRLAPRRAEARAA